MSYSVQHFLGAGGSLTPLQVINHSKPHWHDEDTNSKYLLSVCLIFRHFSPCWVIQCRNHIFQVIILKKNKKKTNSSTFFDAKFHFYILIADPYCLVLNRQFFFIYCKQFDVIHAHQVVDLFLQLSKFLVSSAFLQYMIEWHHRNYKCN